MYRPLYDEKSRAVGLRSDRRVAKHIVQKGLREQLLCDRCERQFSRYESHVADVLKDLPTEIAEPPGTPIPIPAADYTLFKLFHISLFWRCSIASDRHFERVSLGPQEEVARTLLLDENPGPPHLLGCIVLTIKRPNDLDKWMSMPVSGSLQGHPFFRLLVCGLNWTCIASENSEELAQPFLSPSEGLRLIVSKYTEEQQVSSLNRELLGLGLLNES